MPDLRESLSTELDELKANSLHRTCRGAGSGPGFVSFGSNDYLGLARHPAVTEAVARAAMEHGAGSTGSRLTTGTHAAHQEVEAALARLKGTEGAIYFGSGYLAAIGAIPALVGRDDLILSDALNHASLIDGCRLSRATLRVYRHADPTNAAELLSDRCRFRRVLLITDGVFSMDGDLAPLPELVALCDRFDTWLMLDDAHGTGVLGATGAGTVEHFGLQGRVPIQMGTASKALGTEGGFVAGSETLVDLLRNRARSFVYSTAPPPATVAAVLAALRVLETEPELRASLARNAAQLRTGLTASGLGVSAGNTPIIPVIIGEADRALRVSEHLASAGLRVPAIRPPTVPTGTARLRVTVTAAHTSEQIHRAIAAIAEAVRNT